MSVPEGWVQKDRYCIANLPYWISKNPVGEKVVYRLWKHSEPIEIGTLDQCLEAWKREQSRDPNEAQR